MDGIKQRVVQVGLFAWANPYVAGLVQSLVATAVLGLLLGHSGGPVLMADPGGGGTGGV